MALPYFNPDLDRTDAPQLLPCEIGDLRQAIHQSDGVVICSPEYAWRWTAYGGAA
jgi:chromate reductase, NAD(P)H dehydrogenase (quinone)